MIQKLILVGGGGHCRSVIDVVESSGLYNIAGIVDHPEKVGSKIFEYPVIATDGDLPRLVKQFAFFCVAIGHVTSAKRRLELFTILKKWGATFPTLISPRAYVSTRASVGEGTVVMHGAVINANVRVGDNCIINTACVVEHDSIVGDHCHVGPAATINGGCVIGTETLIGSHAVILPGKNVGRNAIVAAGAVVLKDVRENLMVAGIPAKTIKTYE